MNSCCFQLARRQDQVVPLFVMESFGHIPGLAGLFIAGIFNAALRSDSALAAHTITNGFLTSHYSSFLDKQRVPVFRQTSTTVITRHCVILHREYERLSCVVTDKLVLNFLRIGWSSWSAIQEIPYYFQNHKSLSLKTSFLSPVLCLRPSIQCQLSSWRTGFEAAISGIQRTIKRQSPWRYSWQSLGLWSLVSFPLSKDWEWSSK